MRIIIIILLYLIAFPVNSQNSIPTDTAEMYFNEARTISEKDNGKLWGTLIYAPTLFIDTQTRDIVSNDKDNDGLLVKHNDTYTGKFPEDKIIANSTTNLGNKDFTMVMFPLPEDKYTRDVLMIHEMFHYRQPGLGLGLPEGTGYNNAHADEMLARIYFRLEWNALVKALLEDNADLYTKYIKNALIFRAYRHSLFENAEQNEALFELHEGLPEYTGHKLCASSDKEFKEKIIDAKNRIVSNPSYVRSFAYFSGLIYAALLDKTNAEWRKGLKYNNDMGKLLQTACRIQLDADIQSAQDTIKDKYDYSSIYEFESKRKEEKDKVKAQYIEKFTEKSCLIIPLFKPNVGFNPNNIEALGESGTVYPNITIIDLWGKLIVNKGGCLLATNWQQATIPAEGLTIENNIVKTIDWSLEFNNGYQILQDGNNYIIREVK